MDPRRGRNGSTVKSLILASHALLFAGFGAMQRTWAIDERALVLRAAQ